jgi:hypothetical protein
MLHHNGTHYSHVRACWWWPLTEFTEHLIHDSAQILMCCLTIANWSHVLVPINKVTISARFTAHSTDLCCRLFTDWITVSTIFILESLGIESRCGEIFRTYPDQLRGPPSLLYNGYRLFPGGKGGRGVMLTTHPLLVQRLRKSWATPPLTLWVLLGLLRGSLYLLLYLYSMSYMFVDKKYM